MDRWLLSGSFAQSRTRQLNKIGFSIAEQKLFFDQGMEKGELVL